MLMAVYFGGQKFSKIFFAGMEMAKAFLGGSEVFANAPPLPTHTFSIVAVSGGYNGVGNRGSIAAGSTADFVEPNGGRAMTVIHCRRVQTELAFGLRQGIRISDYPLRIVATKTTGGRVEREFTPQAGSFRGVQGGTRQDYDPVSGATADVFVNGATIEVKLYY